MTDCSKIKEEVRKKKEENRKRSIATLGLMTEKGQFQGNKLTLYQLENVAAQNIETVISKIIRVAGYKSSSPKLFPYRTAKKRK